eukprot:gnl/MRDRNA2_/MRDRNA2_123785_c0_seq1.p1 gnl/MRDRNA2_/MRDRNA2_123785_c0~~gnl/MRDRNA2_/MRDRNA2_123785_c0_seq1.p1  ORF type:complete len:451 (+),score=131.89 gnl/MRDRNA2_/MRDRNA2_123785_c0_seq1:82-1434(+)
MDRADKQWHARSQQVQREPAPPALPPAPRAKQAPRRPKAGGVLPPIGKTGPASARTNDTAQTTTVGGPTPRQELSDRSSLDPRQQDGGNGRSAASAASSAEPSPRYDKTVPRRPQAGANQMLEVSRMRQELARQFGTVQKALAQLMPNSKRVTPADLTSALRRIEHCSEDEARRIFQRLDVKMRGVLTFEEIEGEETENSGRRMSGLSEAMSLAQGNEEVIRRAADLAAANAELKRQLSIQADEVMSLETDSRKQRDLFLEHERQVEKQIERVRQEAIAEAEEKQKLAVADAKKAAAEEFRQQLQQVEEARQKSKAEVLALQQQVESLEQKGPRADALEMELRLVRERLEREVEGRRIAEEKVKDGDARYSQLEIHMGKLQRENDSLHRKLQEQVELANYHKEVSGDLRDRIDDVAQQAEMRVLKEKGKKEAIQRLESILPRNILLKAMT